MGADSTLLLAQGHPNPRRSAHRISQWATSRDRSGFINDADDFAEVSTHQRTWVTKLRKNPAAEELEALSYGSTTGLGSGCLRSWSWFGRRSGPWC
jgi:hypothetical protein